MCASVRTCACECVLTVSAGSGQIVVGPEGANGLDDGHYKLHLAVHLVTLPAELQPK